MIETGRVISSDLTKNTVTVQFDRKSACDKCGMCLISKENMKVELILANNLDAKIDDKVQVGMGDSFVLTSALIVYLIPIILIGIALMITRGYSEPIQLISIGSALAVGLIIAILSDRKLRNHKGYNPEIINIIEKSKEETVND